MTRSTNVNKINKSQSKKTNALPSRLNNYFTFVIISYAIVGISAGLYLLVTAILAEVELSKFVQYPPSVPILVAVFVSFFMLYVCIMIRQHLKKDGEIYREDTYVLRGMILTQVLSFNYLTLIPTVLLYLSLRKHSLFTKEKYPHLDDESKAFPIVTEKGFYRITYTIIVMAIIFALLVGIAMMRKL